MDRHLREPDLRSKPLQEMCFNAFARLANPKEPVETYEQKIIARVRETVARLRYANTIMPEVKVGLACSSTQLPQTKRVPTSSRGFPGWLQCVSTCCAASVPAQRLDPRSPRVAPAVPCSCVYCNSFANLVSAAAAPLAYLVCARAWLLDVSDSRLRPCPCSAVCMSLGAHRRSWRARPTARSLSHSISRSVSLSPFPSPPPTHSPRRSHSRSIWVGAHGRTWCCLVPWVCARGRRRMIFKRCTQRSTATRTSSLRQ